MSPQSIRAFGKNDRRHVEIVHAVAQPVDAVVAAGAPSWGSLMRATSGDVHRDEHGIARVRRLEHGAPGLPCFAM